jgi:hypothetical protein
MVDLETFGSTPGSVVVSIGAVGFDPVGGQLGEGFYALIDPASCAAAGLTLDPATVSWWLRQSDAARSALTGGGDVSLRCALEAFAGWWRRHGFTCFWGHGANFDEPLLGAAYRACGLRTPWKYSASRCTRTLFDLAGVQPDRAEGVHHNALDDARAQAIAAMAAFHKLGLASPLTAEPQTGAADVR